MALRRTPLRRGKPLARGSKPLPRRTRIRKSNPARAALQRLRDFGPQAEWMRDLPCATCGAPPPSEPSHVGRTRGAGGTRNDLAPQCSACHEAVHAGRESFEVERGIDLGQLARQYASAWLNLLSQVRTNYELVFAKRYPAAGRLLRDLGY